MIEGYIAGYSSYKRIYECISLLIKPPLIELYHVKGENNGIVDQLANKGARNIQGMVVSNNNQLACKCVP